MGYTPTNFYSDPRIGYGYYLLPENQTDEETMETVLALDGVEDVNINAKRKTLAYTFFKDETTAEKLISEIRQAGIQAQEPKPHECKEEKK